MKTEIKMKSIRVAAAVIIAADEEGRPVLFATQRGYGPYKDKWEFPGGKIEAGETPEEALQREIKEELDTKIEVGEHLTTVEYDYPEFHLSMDCFLCRVLSGGLELKEHEAARWLAADDLGSVEWLPADRIVVEALRKRLDL